MASSTEICDMSLIGCCLVSNLARKYNNQSKVRVQSVGQLRHQNGFSLQTATLETGHCCRIGLVIPRDEIVLAFFAVEIENSFPCLLSYRPFNLCLFVFSGGVNSLFLGVGCGIGTALCGFFIDAIGAVNAFRLFAAGTLVLLVLFVASQTAYYCFKSNKDVERKFLE